MMKKMMIMGFGVLNLTMMIRGSIRGAPKIHWIFYISTYITFSPAMNTGKKIWCDTSPFHIGSDTWKRCFPSSLFWCTTPCHSQKLSCQIGCGILWNVEYRRLMLMVVGPSAGTTILRHHGAISYMDGATKSRCCPTMLD